MADHRGRFLRRARPPLATHRRSTANASTAGAFAAKAKDLGALRESAIDAAGVGAGLWLSYLFLFFYLFIAVAAVTYRDLLFENPVKLPFLNVELPLLGFFVLGPLLFRLLYAYVLLHFAMLTDKVGVFDAELRAQIGNDDIRARLRRQLPSNIFVQYLADPDESAQSRHGTLMLRLIALISLVLFPIALLVFFQLQFLPYHDRRLHGGIASPSCRHFAAVDLLAVDCARKVGIDFMARLAPSEIIALLPRAFSTLAHLYHFDLPGRMAGLELPSLPLVPTKWPAWTS